MSRSSSVRNHTNTYSKCGLKSRCDFLGVCDMIENFDKVEADAHGPDADAGVYSQGGWYGGKGRVVKAGIYAKVTTGRAEARASIFSAHAEGPSAEVGAEATHVPYTPIAGVTAGAEASLFKAGVRAGPALAEINPNLNTGASVGLTHASVNFLGFGASIGSTTYVATPLGKIGIWF